MTFLYDLKERHILKRYPDWRRIDYPFPRGERGHKYSVYTNSKFGEGVWDLDDIEKLESGELKVNTN